MWFRDKDKRPKEWIGKPVDSGAPVAHVSDEYAVHVFLWIGLGLVALWGLLQRLNNER